MFQSVVMFMGIFAILIKVRSLNKVKKYLYIYKSLLQRFKYHLVSVCCFDFIRVQWLPGACQKLLKLIKILEDWTCLSKYYNTLYMYKTLVSTTVYTNSLPYFKALIRTLLYGTRFGVWW